MADTPWLSRLRPHKLPFRRHVSRAAVALVYRPAVAGDELLFIQRSQRADDPWSGDMAFPGGRLQAEDDSSRATAIRETREETGLDLLANGHYQARLSDLLTRHHSRWTPMVVTPHVFAWQGDSGMSLNHEAQRGLWIPIDYLANPAHRDTLTIRTPLGGLTLPCCRYQGYCIWGLSFSMLQEFLRQR